MESLNYHHLLYFWVVAKEGGLVSAAKSLHLSHPTLSAQIHALEDRLGEKLFAKSGRRLRLTEVGQLTFRYADEIFGLGQELLETLRGKSTGKPLRLDVGVVDVLPKLVVRRLLAPALSLAEPVRLVCHEGDFGELLGQLAQHTLDIVIADSPVPSGSAIRAHTHLLGESSIAWFAAPGLAGPTRRGFPKSLDGAPMLLPTENLTLRRSLNQWFEKHAIRPRIVAEFEDSALMNVFGAEGLGLFPASEVVANDIASHYDVQRIGVAEEVFERFYAISVERRIKNPAVLAISQSAQTALQPAGRAAKPAPRRGERA